MTEPSRFDRVDTSRRRTLVLRGEFDLGVRRGFGDGSQCCSASLDLGDDLLGGLGPDAGLRVVVSTLGSRLDAFDQNVDARECAAP